MIVRLVLTLCCLCLLAGFVSAQEVIIADFPIGVGGSVNPDLFKSHQASFQAIADTLHKYPLARAIITGGADGEKYRRDHDAKNPGLALGRAHILRALLIDEFKVDSTQLIIQSEDTKIKGGEHRFASIRIDRDLADLDSRLSALENRPPIEKHIVEPAAATLLTPAEPSPDVLGLQLGAGATSSPFGVMPMVAAAFTWKRMVFVEAYAGHSFWNDQFDFLGRNLDTKTRIIGGQVIYYPTPGKPVGIVAGWTRMEEISQSYYEYVRLSEGPQLGLRFTPLRYLSATVVYNPAKHRTAGKTFSEMKNDQFLVSIIAHLGLGGAR